ncbi:hypothetical protein CPB83DRAFT_881806 [Crepidotus variabilis]|uniref:SH3 domain-containing protein n=1 Tax=Crepidotus variabilis TaxID=179855 RepID=A0A9P6EL37_9AGAR|nr:hypothetical protein CPB83DRAFT_881806 [Crepidotus variabilis]
MASAVYSEPPASRLSISLESPATASPFPSPSSSFLTPPTPGAHEFAVKPVPASARAGRKGSVPSLSNMGASQNHTTINSSRSPSASPRTSAAISSVINGEGLVTGQNTKASSQRSSLSHTQLAPASQMVDPGSGAVVEPATTSPSQPQDLVVPTLGLSPLPSPRSDTLISPATPTPASVQRQPGPPSKAATLQGRSLEPPRSPAPFASTSSTSTPTVTSTRLPQEFSMKSVDDRGSSTPQVSPETYSSRNSVNQDTISDSLSKILSPTSASSHASTSSAPSTTSPQIASPSNAPRPRPTISTRRSSRPLSTASMSSTSSVGSSTSATGSGTVLAFDSSLFSSRPAPPSPGGPPGGPLSGANSSFGGSGSGRPTLSRSVSTASRTSMRDQRTGTGDRSRPPSVAVSRANSVKSKRASASSFASPTSTPVSGNPHSHPMSSPASLNPNDNNNNTLSGRVGGDSLLGFGSANGIDTPTNNVNSNNNLQQRRVSVTSQLNPSFKLPSVEVQQKDMGSAISAVFGGGSGSGSVESSQTSTAPSTSSRTSQSLSSEPPPSVESVTTTSLLTAEPEPTSATQTRVFIKIRDFGFQPSDERHNGFGQFVPKPNRVGRMNRRLEAAMNRPNSSRRTNSTASLGSEFSVSSSDGDGLDDEDDGDLDGWGWGGGGGGFGGGGYSRAYGGSWGGNDGGGGGGFKMGMGRFSWSGAGAATAATIFDQEKAYAAAAANLAAASSSKAGYPSQTDMDRNFLDSSESSEEFYDAEDDDMYYDDEDGEGDGEDDTLYPGLYRAMYAFEPEGTAEMRLEEDQIVRVVGRGGGVGWAVVVTGYEHGAQQLETGEINMAPTVMKAPKHALVPESYLEPYKLDWELEEDGVGTSTPAEE